MGSGGEGLADGLFRAYLKKNKYARIVAHLDGELEETVKDTGLEAVFTGAAPAVRRCSGSPMQLQRPAATEPLDFPICASCATVPMRISIWSGSRRCSSGRKDNSERQRDPG